jgi:WD40 repeat protein
LKNMSTPSRLVRVFLSSTFRDFAEERDLLVRKVFPELRRKCRERQVELVDVDLRWGITEEEAQQGKVLPICLAEIDRSRPFFMGFIGERYGWIPEPEKYDLSLIMDQPWLDEHRGGKSVTELEMLHGVLNNPAMEDRAFFYFRDPAWSQKKGGAYLSEGSLEKEKLESLKDRIRQSGYPVLEDYPTPEALAEQVKKDLWKLIDESFPESEVPDALAQERMRHEAFAASRSGLYIGGERYFEALHAAMVEEPCKPVLVTGASGGGKSALLANWAQRFSTAHPETIVLTHFLGTGADAAHPVSMAIRIISEISRMTGEEFVLEGDPRKALRLLEPWLEKAGVWAREKGSVFVLVLDALDKMTEHRDLEWWPRRLPEGVALFASCLDGEIRDALLPKLEWSELRVSPLERSDCEKFLREHLAKYRKSLTLEQTALALEHPLCGNPLFLRTLLEELRVFGVHEELNLRLKHYLASETIDDLFEKVLDRIESDNTPETVRAALEVLWAAKESFAEDELLIVSQLPPAIWAPIHIALDESLIGAGGRLAFSHDYLRKAVEDRYLNLDQDRHRIKQRMAEFCAQAMAESREETSRYVRRHAVEHFLEAEDWDNTADALTDFKFIEVRADAQELNAMLLDYAKAVQLFPEGKEERDEEASWKKKLKHYEDELFEYASIWSRIRQGSGEAKPTLPRPTESLNLRSNKEIDAERIRISNRTNRLDIIKEFRIFISSYLEPLQKISYRNKFAYKLAVNLSPLSKLKLDSENHLATTSDIYFHKIYKESEKSDLLNSCIAILSAEDDQTIWSVTITSTGEKVITGSDDGKIRIWDLNSLACQNVLIGHSGRVLTIRAVRSIDLIVSGSSDNTLKAWKISTGECIKTFSGHEDIVNCIDITPDGSRIISASNDGTLRVWSCDSGECEGILSGHEDPVYRVAITIDGCHAMSTSSDGSVRIWDIDDCKCLKVYNGITDQFWSTPLAMSLDAQRWALAGVSKFDNGRAIFLVDGKGASHLLPGNSDHVITLGMTPDGKLLVSGGFDRTIRVWDINSKESKRAFTGHKGAIYDLSITPDGRYAVSASDDCTVRIWNLENSELNINSQKHYGDINCILYIPTKKITATCSDDQNIRIWDQVTGECKNEFKGHKDSVLSLVSSNDGRYLFSGSADNTIRIWDLETGECLNVLKGHTDRISSITSSACGRRIVSASWDTTLRIWDLETGECLNVLKGHTDRISSITSSACGRNIASSGDDQTIHIWDIETGRCLTTLKGHTNSVKDLSFTPNGLEIVTSSSDNTLRIWNIKNAECVLKICGCQRGYFQITNDGENLIYFSNKFQINLFNINNKICSGVLFSWDLSDALVHATNSELMVGTNDGRVEFFKIQNLPFGPLITTARREIISEALPSGSVTARPPCCGQLISIPETISERIEHWSLDEIEGGHSDPALLLDCPHCQTPLRMNPFFVDVKPTSTK